MPRKKKNVLGYQQSIERTKVSDIPAVEFAKQLIVKNHASHIHSPMLADRVGINEFKLKIAFTELFKASPYEHWLHLCQVSATALLTETCDTIDQIAPKAGFDINTDLRTAFKKLIVLHHQPIKKRRKAHANSIQAKNKLK